jgi:hypothetical protein
MCCDSRAYAVLGVVADVNDRIILWAYNRQRDCNPNGTPLYFEHLSVLANGRNSDTLQLEVAKLRSQGAFTMEDLENACRALGVESTETDEELIIGIFRSRLSDAPRQEAQMREHLRVIGQVRNSFKIKQAAQKGNSTRPTHIYQAVLTNRHSIYGRQGCLQLVGCARGNGKSDGSLNIPSQSRGFSYPRLLRV